MNKFILVLFLMSVGTAMAIEEPDYKVLKSSDAYEVREYASFNVAEVDVSGDRSAAGSSAFRVLAGYIFGNNEPGEKMAMTAPVVSQPLDEGGYVYAFVMERKYDMESLPKPVDSRIRLVNRPAHVMAVRRYSGRWSEQNDRRQERSLIEALKADNVSLLGEPILARYNSPWTPWFRRRNEVMIEIEWP